MYIYIYTYDQLGKVKNDVCLNMLCLNNIRVTGDMKLHF